MLVIYCHVTTYGKLSNLKQPAFIISQFCGSGIHVQLSWVLLAQDLSQGCKVMAESKSCEGSPAEDVFMRSLTKLASGPCWNISFLPCRSLHRADHNMATGFPQSERVRKDSPTRKPPSLCNLIWKVTSLQSCYIPFIGRSSSYSRGDESRRRSSLG